jgi:hypothetical protein
MVSPSYFSHDNHHPHDPSEPPAKTHSKPFLPTPAFPANLSTLAFSSRLAIILLENPDVIMARCVKSVEGELAPGPISPGLVFENGSVDEGR